MTTETVTTLEYWLVGSPTGEWVMYYNPTGCVMHFTTDRAEARRTETYADAMEWQRVARSVYKRASFKAVYVVE